MHSDVLPHPNNPLEIWENMVEIDEELQDTCKLTMDQLEFLEMVGNTLKSAAMCRNSNLAPRQMGVMECYKTVI